MDSLRKLAEGATPGAGPRLAVDAETGNCAVVCKVVEGYERATLVTDSNGVPFKVTNAAYIAAASPDRILLMLDVIDAARKIATPNAGSTGDMPALRTSLAALEGSSGRSAGGAE